ncbi:MAG: PBP1A family penicillin-binding protein [Patescibacteria group bacterium]|nr:PBP1A family penicillin-binding protein [Patescibacteria group bacterium]MDD4304166.1 PBP1A family penicillin-binding protein [Patescibacteria group bacterium]MDD4695198.1 PBP1A family penicillin-binding protein [Patescibacteria group bacterium]
MPIDHFKNLGNKSSWTNKRVGSSNVSYSVNPRIQKLQKRKNIFKTPKIFSKKLNVELKNRPIKNISTKYTLKSLKKNKKQFKKFIIKMIPKAIIAFILLLIFTLILFAWYSRDLPDPNKIIDRSIVQSTKIYDKTGETMLYDVHGNVQRTLIEIKDLPPYVVNATISIEDKNFYNHKGISIWGILRGQIVPRLKGQRAQGGSTLTQQFVKNAILTDERSIERKIKEWILSYRIERKYSKEEILKMYFNEIPYGSVLYGIESASNYYFDKHAKDLTIAEAATLAAMPQAPSYYSPYGPNREELIGRQQYILGLMLKQKYITQEEHDNAIAEKLVFKQKENNIKAPHFVFYVKDELVEILGEKLVEQGGLKVITTLDYKKQEFAENLIKEKTENYPSKYNANNAALLSIDVKSGDIISMVGSRDFWNDDIDGQVNITLSKRQPGSSIKPLIYTLAFEKGYQPETIVFDVPTIFKTDSGNYEPKNYDLKNHGPIALRNALSGSLNIPAVKVLYLVGIPNALNYLKNIGYTTIGSEDRYGLSLVLGGLEVKMMEHLNGFATLARNGVEKPTRSILKVEDSNGKVLYEAKDSKGKKVMDEEATRKTTSALSDNSARSFIFGENNYLTLGDIPVAAKTGTTNDFNDAWTIGYTPNIATAVWVGNNDNKKMTSGADGSVVAAPIWNAFMREALKDIPKTGFAGYDRKEISKPMLGGAMMQETKVRIDSSSGLLATENTPPGSIIEKTFNKIHNILHYINREDPLGSIPEDPSVDPNYFSWEEAVVKWAKENNIETSDPPTEYETTHTEENKPNLNITSPQNNSTISENNINIEVNVNAKNGNEINRVVYKIDDKFIGSNNNYPYNYNYDFNDLIENGEHILSVIVYDQDENFREQKIKLYLDLTE